MRRVVRERRTLRYGQQVTTVRRVRRGQGLTTQARTRIVATGAMVEKKGARQRRVAFACRHSCIDRQRSRPDCTVACLRTKRRGTKRAARRVVPMRKLGRSAERSVVFQAVLPTFEVEKGRAAGPDPDDTKPPAIRQRSTPAMVGCATLAHESPGYRGACSGQGEAIRLGRCFPRWFNRRSAAIPYRGGSASVPSMRAGRATRHIRSTSTP